MNANMKRFSYVGLMSGACFEAGILRSDSVPIIVFEAQAVCVCSNEEIIRIQIQMFCVACIRSAMESFSNAIAASCYAVHT